jgi:hypothetical protein
VILVVIGILLRNYGPHVFRSFLYCRLFADPALCSLSETNYELNDSVAMQDCKLFELDPPTEEHFLEMEIGKGR